LPTSFRSANRPEWSTNALQIEDSFSHGALTQSSGKTAKLVACGIDGVDPIKAVLRVAIIPFRDVEKTQDCAKAFLLFGTSSVCVDNSIFG